MSEKGLRICKAIAKAVIVLAVLAIVLFTVIIPKVKKNNKYKAAVQQVKDGNIIEAYESLIDLDGYKDSDEIASGLREQYKLEKMKTAEVGDSIFIGTYEQDKDQNNGKEEIEWIVLDKKEKDYQRFFCDFFGRFVLCFEKH